jgi:hypothetical protein
MIGITEPGGGAVGAKIGRRAPRHALAAALIFLAASPVAAQDLKSELQRFLYDEAQANLHLRSYYFDRNDQRPPRNVALAGGGWIGLQSGWFYDTVQLGAVGYSTQPLWAPQGPVETSNLTRLLKRGGYGFFSLGQAYASARWQDQVFTAYRQSIDELEVNPRDNRMIPQTFEAYALRGAVGPVRYFGGYVAAMKPRDESDFINMAEAAGALNANAGMLLGTLRYGSAETFGVRAGSYVVPDILWSSYGDVAGTITIDEDFRIQLAAQLGVQGSNGANRLTDRPFSTFWAGGQAQALWGPFLLRLAYTQTGSAARWRSPYGVFIGYNKRQVLDFDRAGERALTVAAGYDFASIGLRGLRFTASATYGADAVLAETGTRLPEVWEYDLDLQFGADRLPVPDWLKPLQLRGRVAFVDRYLAGEVTSLTEYRVILNYAVTWQGPRRAAR